MSVTIRPYRGGGWEIEIRVVTPDGARDLRERRRAPMSSRSAAVRWAEGRERVLFDRLVSPAPDSTSKKEVPTLQAFAPRFIDGHARANRLKPSGIASKNAILRLYLIPAFGRKRLDAIKSEDVQRLKAQLEFKSPKTVNNVLAVLSVLLKKAVEWEVIERMPCTVKLLRVDKGTAAFHDFDEYERLVEVARSIDPRTLLVVLLGGDAGMRCGEILALEWNDVDLVKRRASRNAEEWTATICAAHATVDRGARRASAPAKQAGALPGGRLAVHTADRAEPDDPGGAASEREEGRTHPSSHVLLALVDAGCAGEGDSGGRGARRPDDDAALHAPEPGRTRCGHPAARRTAARACFGLNRAVNPTLSDAPSCRSLETWGRRAARIKNDQ
jgi:hypothetical protein